MQNRSEYLGKNILGELASFLLAISLDLHLKWIQIHRKM